MGKFEEIYRKIESRELPECGGTGIVYEHRKTGARICTLKNSDKNKVFFISFRTTPSDSTGTAHILEHSVLCGSEKFPLKDPFIELAKGSLNTFLNAMTYPDKTVYPVASCNEKDFMNLMDVYLDAVFHPRIYAEEKIFRQEGWRYEPAEDGTLQINGVVYNEMKGVFSDGDAVLERYTLNALFPGTTYENESGGDPEQIPSLTYEEFLDFHRRYYHPSNSYLYLYGDQDMEERLLWIDREYLSTFDRREIDSAITSPEPFTEKKYLEKVYAVSKGEGTENKTFLSENYVLPPVDSSLKDLAWEVLEFVLLTAPGAPLREGLLSAGFGEDIYGGYSCGIRQPYFSIIARNSEKEKLPAFQEKIREILTGIVQNGLDRKSLLAALNYLEFKYREEDFGRFPAGLSYGLSIMESWLYDQSPFLFLTYAEELKELRRLSDSGFFEELLSEAFLKNSHAASVVVVPSVTLMEEKERQLAGKLQQISAALTAEERETIRREAEELEKYQEEPDSEELKKCLPVLSLEDIEKKAEPLNCRKEDGILFTETDTRGIAYIHLIWDLSGFSEEEVQFVALLRSLFGELNTEKHTFKELSDELLLRTGGVDFAVQSFFLPQNGPRSFQPSLIADIRTFADHIPDGLEIAMEMLRETLFEDTDRIIEKLIEAKTRMQAKIESFSHTVAVSRSLSYTEAFARFDDLTGGIAYLDFLNGACRLVKEPVHQKRFLQTLVRTCEKLRNCPFEIALAGDRKMLTLLREKADALNIPENGETVQQTPIRPVSKLNEGVKMPSQVNYVARTGRFFAEGERQNGAVSILRVYLNYEYLWKRLRVDGGAYGCMSGVGRSGMGYLVSYRDPKLRETNEVYEALPGELEKLDLSEEELRKYIIGAVSGMDQPVTASIRAIQELNSYFRGATDEERQKERDDVLQCTVPVLRGFAKNVRRMLDEGCFCVIGSEESIRKENAMFRSVRELL